MSDMIYGLVKLISFALNLLTYAIIIRALLSWFRPNPNNSLVRLLVKITNPILRPLGRIIPPIAGLDITPIVAIILIQLVQRIIVSQFSPMLLGMY